MNHFSEKHRKVKIAAGLILLGLLLVYCVASVIYLLSVHNNGEVSLSQALLFETGIGYSFVNAMIFNTEAIDEYVAVSVGGTFYFAILAFVLSIIMVIAKKAFHHIANPFVSLLSLTGFSYFLCGYISADGKPYENLKVFCMISLTVLGIIGVLALVFAMVFPLARTSDAYVDPAPERIAKNEVILSPSGVTPPVQEEQPEASAEPQKLKKPAKPAQKPSKPEEKPASKPVKKPASKPQPEVVKEPKAPAKKPVNNEDVHLEVYEEETTKTSGKYEVFPEAGFYKYRLKANNGEILIVSSGYKAKNSAIAGIETLKKNLPTAFTRIVTDKNGFAQFRIPSSNDSRLIATGEIYSNASSANSALASVMKFYDTDKVVVLDELPMDEVREWEVELPEPELVSSGKIEIVHEDEKYMGKLYANNGEVLLVTSTYSSRKALLSAIENLREKVLIGRITIARDKQNRYQYRLFSDNGMILVVGETYSSKDGAISSAISTRRFLPKAKIIK